MRYPTDNSYVSSGYGWRVGLNGEPNFHNGADFPRPVGGRLYAIQDGVVTQNRWSAAGGWTVAIRFNDNVTGYYQHMVNQSALNVGQEVAEGAIVGIMGKTGAYVDGVHLHFETWANGGSFDPVPYLQNGTTAGGDVTPLPDPEEEEEDMAKMKGAAYTRAKDNKVVYILFNEESGFYVEHTGTNSEYNNAIARNWETNSWPTITEAHVVVIKAALDKVRLSK